MQISPENAVETEHGVENMVASGNKLADALVQLEDGLLFRCWLPSRQQGQRRGGATGNISVTLASGTSCIVVSMIGLPDHGYNS
jgi:hypothetical protein